MTPRLSPRSREDRPAASAPAQTVPLTREGDTAKRRRSQPSAPERSDGHPGGGSGPPPARPATPFFDRPDALGRRVVLPAPPRRIVSLVPSQTELLADLGLDAETVGLTRFCVHPDGWKTRKAIVGGTKNVDAERVRALAPDLVIANKEENVREQVEALAEFCPVWVTDVGTVDDALAMIRDVGALADRRHQAAALADAIGAGFETLPQLPPLRALYLIWRDPWMSVGYDTIIADVMDRAGLVNVTDESSRYPVLQDYEFELRAPEVVLLSSEPYPFSKKHVAEVQALAPDARVVLVDGEPFSWYGSRLLHTPGALRPLRAALAPAGHTGARDGYDGPPLPPPP